MPVFQLSDKIGFPPPHLAEREGLLAIGGDLSVSRLLVAYRMGIFPWYLEEDPIIWWSPDPRLVLYPKEFRISRSLRKRIRKGDFTVTFDCAFETVISECAHVREETGQGTWIVPEMKSAYCGLHAAGFAHSVETWQDGELAGGLYGVSLGKGFFGESMFTRRTDASKVAFAALVAQLERWGFHFIDCQVKTGHLMRFGAREIPRKHFLKQLAAALKHTTLRGSWRMDEDIMMKVG